MTPTEAITFLRAFNEWRRGDEDIPQFDPREIGEAIDAAVEMIGRLEAAEKSDAEILAMYRKARDERDALRAAVRHEADCVEAAKAEIKALRAKVDTMEKQEPVAWIRGRDEHRRRKLSFERPAKSSPDKFHWSPLYALPGAQPAPIVQDVPAKSLKPVIDWLRNGCDPQEAAKELEILIAAAPKPEGES